MKRDIRQKLGVDKWIKSGCRGTLQWAPGVGKTRAGILGIKVFLSKNKGKKVVVVVPSEYLKLQWIQELNKSKLFNEVNVEIINSAIKLNSPVDLLILDEAHKIGSTTFYSIFNVRTPKLVLGLSAVFSRLDGRHELLNAFCPVCDIITVQEAIDNNWISTYIEYKVLIEPDDIAEYNEYSTSFYDSFAVFNFDFQVGLKCLTNIIYRRTYGKSMGISVKEMDAITFTWNRALQARKKYITDHPIKLRIAEKILNARRNSKAVTFSATIKQAEKFKYGFILHSGKTKKKNRITLQEFNNVETGVIHSSKSLDEGVDIPGLNLAIILCNNSSGSQKTQRIGRVTRQQEGKEAEIFTLVLKGTSEESWYNTSTSGKEYIEINEEELDLVLKNTPINKIKQEAVASELLFRI